MGIEDDKLKPCTLCSPLERTFGVYPSAGSKDVQAIEEALLHVTLAWRMGRTDTLVSTMFGSHEMDKGCVTPAMDTICNFEEHLGVANPEACTARSVVHLLAYTINSHTNGYVTCFKILSFAAMTFAQYDRNTQHPSS